MRRQLDREITPLYNLFVIAKDDRSSLDIFELLNVRIEISDVNDNAPVFQKNKFYVNDSMYENTISEDIKPPRYVLTVRATDKDMGINQKIKYSISSGNNDGLFSINDGGKLYLVRSVDRDVIPIHRLSVRATDQGR